MKLSALLTTDRIILNLRSQDREGAIAEIVSLIESNDLLGPLCEKEVQKKLNNREQQNSTGIGSGVAIPHAFCDELDEVICVFARSVEGVEFEAIDHAPVNFIVLFLVPQKDYCMHLQTLAAIAKMFKSCGIRKQLLAAEAREEILSILDCGAPDRGPKKKKASSTVLNR